MASIDLTVQETVNNRLLEEYASGSSGQINLTNTNTNPTNYLSDVLSNVRTQDKDTFIEALGYDDPEKLEKSKETGNLLRKKNDELIAQQKKATEESINDNMIVNNGKPSPVKYYIPSIGTQISSETTGIPQQTSPFLNSYSPRLFGAPPQLTNMCDMRLLSAYDETHYGPVGDFYLTKVLRDASICNFAIGRARFTGGTATVWGSMKLAYHYAKAMKKYDIYDSNNNSIVNQAKRDYVMMENSVATYNSSMGDDDEDVVVMTTAGEAGLTELDPDETVLDLESTGIPLILDEIGDMFIKGGATLVSQLKTSLSVNQPFYTFESDWTTYINNVKMMINSAVIMLGLQNAPVRIGDSLYSISMSTDLNKNNDAWSNYRFITPTEGLGAANMKEEEDGDSSQYTSFMVDPSSFNESYTNAVGDSQLFGSMKQGETLGAEIAFLTNASVSKVDDFIVNLADKATNVAQQVLSNLGGGIGRFTAAIAGGFTRSFIGDHTIYPQIYQSSSSTTNISITTHLVADSGDPYSYLINILVPLFHLFAMALPRLSKNNAAAYQYPPVIQANIPGLWGTRLGMITSLTIQKNPSGKDVSINGYPMAVDVTVSIADLQHVLVTSPMNQVSCFLNNNTMFDYIAQICGCDKYRVNPSIRLVTKLALAASYVDNMGYNIGNALLSDFNSWAYRATMIS